MDKSSDSPEWVKRRMESEYQERPHWTDEEDELLRHAYFGLLEGQLQPLANLLKSSAGGLHPVISNSLVAMIEKDERSEFFIESNINSERINRAKQSSIAQWKKTIEDKDIAMIIARYQGHLPGQYEAALIDAKEEIGLSRSELAKIWSRYKKRKKSSVRYFEWVAALSKKHGGLNALIALEEAGVISTTPPKDFEVIDFKEKIRSAIDRELELDTRNKTKV